MQSVYENLVFNSVRPYTTTSLPTLLQPLDVYMAQLNDTYCTDMHTRECVQWSDEQMQHDVLELQLLRLHALTHTFVRHSRSLSDSLPKPAAPLARSLLRSLADADTQVSLVVVFPESTFAFTHERSAALMRALAVFFST